MHVQEHGKLAGHRILRIVFQIRLLDVGLSRNGRLAVCKRVAGEHVSLQKLSSRCIAFTHLRMIRLATVEFERAALNNLIGLNGVNQFTRVSFYLL